MPGFPDVSVLRAAARAGATALLNLEGVRDQSDVDAAVAALVTGKPGALGLRIDSQATLALLPPLDRLAAIDVFVLGTRVAERSDVVRSLRSPGRTVLLECTGVEDAYLGERLAVDGLVAKGHEAGGRVGEETTFVLVQHLLSATRLPVWAHGGISTHTAPACAVAGCAGAVLDAQVLLARESTLPSPIRAAVQRMAGDETICLGTELREQYRVYRRPGLAAVEELGRLESMLAREGAALDPDAWGAAIRARINWRFDGAPLWPLGQDAACAADLSRRFRSVSGILAGLREAIATHARMARERRPLAPGAPLAVAHGTRYPIMQGPMTRVSDVAAFAAAVADGGGLPFLALALLRGPDVQRLLEETKTLLGDRKWGVGILGFVPMQLREEQLAVVERFAPPFAIIAGGRPDQAAKLARHGTSAYLHVPAPSLLKIFLDEGARHFIFEGRECGGHVGPRTSFVLWQLAISTIEDAIRGGIAAESLHVVLAGGIHDARSAAMAATISAPLAELGVRVGVLIGTGYLFTREAVASGAIVEAFQQEALECERTVLLETGPGHSTRCAETPLFESFRDLRRRLVSEGKSPDDIRAELEMWNLGRLRIASKGIKRETAATPDAPSHVTVGADEQRRDGMYMIGQVAALPKSVCTIADLHEDVSSGSVEWLDRRAGSARAVRSAATPAATSAQVAIVGMGCLLPGAHDVRRLWSNILNKRDTITEIPRERFDIDRYFSEDRRARDRVYTRWGGFLEEVAFDPLKHGIPPGAMPSIDPFQLLTLEVVHQALGDAGYADRAFNRERTSVILGASGGVGDLGFRYGIRSGLPMYFDDIPGDVLSRLPEWTEDSFAGVLLNVAAGRVANRLDLGGLNFTVDAACASSLAAVFLAARELEAGGSDMVLVGGIDTVNSPFGFLCFGSAQALSPRGRCRTFDATADGIAISEGLVALVLKRLPDAERDGDRIYAVIRAVAGSSDGRGKGMSAPRPEGQMRVLERAYEVAGISPATVGLIEAHGTGTVAGDAAEVAALSRVFTSAGARPQACALGSIKSMIGHTKSAAGVSGLAKVALALHHKTLPPTIHVTHPNAKLREAETPFYVNTEARPWVAPGPDQPRRAGVSSFGFGGTNFHVVVEEYDGQSPGVVPDTAPVEEWPAELAVWTSPSLDQLSAALARAERTLAVASAVPLRHAAAAICRQEGGRASTGPRLAIVATSTSDLAEKVGRVREAITRGQTALIDAANGIYLGSAASRGKLAFLFPGQGSQYPWMHRDLSVCFPEVRQSLELADEATAGQFSQRLSSFVFPPPAFDKQEETARLRALTDTAIAQPALGAVEAGLVNLLRRLGVKPDCTAGHSYGEYVALFAAGVLRPETLFTVSAARGRFITHAAGPDSGTMAAVIAPAEAVRRVIGEQPDVWIANMNAPRQTVIAGSVAAVERAIDHLAAAGLTARRIPVACAFHSPLVAAAQQEMAGLLAETDLERARVPVFSNALAAPYPDDPDQMRHVLAEHLVRPVRFTEEVLAMHDHGARVFLEVGPRSVLTNLAREILNGREATIIAVDGGERHGLVQLLDALAQLTVAGVPLDLEALWAGRPVSAATLNDLPGLVPAAPPAHAWMVSGGHARRLAAPKPTRAAATPQPTSAPEPPAARIIPVPAAAVAVRPAPPARPVVPQRLSRFANVKPSNGGVMQPEETPIPETYARSSDEVMQQFQQLMSQFLQTQALVMTAYLQGAPQALPAAPARAIASPPLARRPVEETAFVLQGSGAAVSAPVHAPMPKGGNGQTAAASVTSQPVAAPVPSQPAPPPPIVVDTARPSSHQGARALATSAPEVLKQLVGIVAERTGYPEDMLDVDLSLEADLGIDSIKRMEILAAFQQLHAAPRDTFQDAMERLTSLKTLRETAASLAELLSGRGQAAIA